MMAILQTESNFADATHLISLAVNSATFVLLAAFLKQHKIWIRIKDRVNTMWFKHCHESGERFTPVEGNGHND